MTNKTRPYNTGKAVTRDDLDNLIKSAKGNGDWSKVEQANVSEITDMFRLFDGVKGIKNLNIDGWDTSNVEDMGGMFYSSDYNHPLQFNTLNVEYTAYMFYNSDYNHPLLFNTSKVTDMQSMFANSKYNHPLYFDTPKVKDMNDIFNNSSITHPITFNGGNIPDDIQAFIDQTNITYEEKCKLEGVIHNKCDTNETVLVSSFKL